MTPPFTYVLPIRAASAPSDELTTYIQSISACCRVVIVDGSPDHVFHAAHDRWRDIAEHIPPDPDIDCANGKVRGVLTGLRRVRTPFVIIADDDVRYTETNLEDLAEAVKAGDVFVPQNYFDPLPWHAVLDTGRTLLNRVTGGDFPGTLAVRMSVLERTAGYDGDVLFENLELIRTVEAAGGIARSLPGLFVRRLPPTTRHFFGQRIRQAYDEFARPARLITWLMILPLMMVASRRRSTLLFVTTGIVAAAETGRRVKGGRNVFHASSALLAPVWVMERAVCVWLALAVRALGGVRYSGGRIACAAHSRGQLMAVYAVGRES